SQPVKLDHLQAQLHNFQLEYGLLHKEHQDPLMYQERLIKLSEKISNLEQEISQLRCEWQQELELIQQIKSLQAQPEQSEKQNQITALRRHSAQIQAPAPLVFEGANTLIINQLISDWTGIPVGKMMHTEIQQVLTLRDK